MKKTNKVFGILLAALLVLALFPVTAWAAAPGVPQNLRATPGDREVMLSWEAPSDGGPVMGYNVNCMGGGSQNEVSGITATT
ncbi:fibronectin type III domain-containing protein [Christensenellaceae bacterium OttesenSCG-928-K19]|nr:fibronectin type III domain-containing protein [Christensenellaceae bacterium OttesenSCG-928-K19]